MDLGQLENVVAGVDPGGPGLAVGVYADGKLLHWAARGVSTVEFGVPIDSRTRFDIASISKQFTAACLLLLAGEGKLSLTDDVRSHLPDLRLQTPVTLGQCLRHTGGLPEWYGVQGLTGIPLQGLDEEHLMAVLSGVRRTAFEPGTAFSYSNTGYVLASAVVRRVSGQSLADFARDRLFGPLGMDDTAFRDDAAVPMPRMAFGYDRDGRRADTQESVVGDGGVVTSVSDLAPWFGFLADGRVLGAGLREALLETAPLADGTPSPYAHGIYHLSVGELQGYGHAGGMHGYVANLLYLPGPGLGVAVLTNHSGLDPVGLSTRLARGLTGQEPQPSPALAGPGAGEAARTALLGHWHDPASGSTLTLTPDEEGMIRVTDVSDAVVALGSDGRWHDLAATRRAWLALEGERLIQGDTLSIRPPVSFVRCEGPGEDPAPEGAWLSDEYGVLAVVREGVLRVGLTLRAPVVPAPAGAWSAGPFTLRLDTDGDLLISGFGLRESRFTAQPPGTAPLGIPPGLV
ncbi:serine hydrolase domain-containing protein [Nonomuraea soli]|uniref:CubicO group peptidase (Beta-lactamase class C family) n=1 Tax=Nonomuraea soli TaxID=1032476 RepID=A0A7W0HP26_9ACTN|nr:serine hydrolase domain-containing protein [Nonomuraea soli]MBA2890302.1 CubicO group peptidase (beta-lactamase class C family) [Nonomuraea soli]